MINSISVLENKGCITVKNEIENPKVFISYAWGDSEYQNLVLSFANKLIGDGIDVLLDKWNLTEGNDTNAYMEKCVTDKTITNVLILLDPLYAEKADTHRGGVGTETQIISEKVYKEVEQSRFIPIVMKRDANGNICKPTYLQSRLHFDLTVPEKYETEYKRLVKMLYGIEVFVKPPIGNKPEWVDKPLEIPHNTIIKYDSMKNNIEPSIRSNDFSIFLNEISNRLIEFASNKDSCTNLLDYIHLYDDSSDIRNSYLLLLSYSSYITKPYKLISVFFENTWNSVYKISTTKSEIICIRIHELFIYTIAFFIKNKLYSSAGYMLGKSYFSNTKVINNDYVDSFHMFYSSSMHTNLDNAICMRDNKKYHSGTAQHWIETIAADFCDKEHFVLADLICFNYSVYGVYLASEWLWFPLTYPYDDRFSSYLSSIGRKLVSREFALEILPLWGYDSLDEFITNYKEKEEDIKNGKYNTTKYNMCFNRPFLLSDFTSFESIGKYR